MAAGRCYVGPKRSMRAAVIARRMVMAIFVLAYLIVGGRVAGASAEVINTQVQRKIDVTTQFAKVSMIKIFVHAGETNPRPCCILLAACCVLCAAVVDRKVSDTLDDCCVCVLCVVAEQ